MPTIAPLRLKVPKIVWQPINPPVVVPPEGLVTTHTITSNLLGLMEPVCDPTFFYTFGNPEIGGEQASRWPWDGENVPLPEWRVPPPDFAGRFCGGLGASGGKYLQVLSIAGLEPNKLYKAAMRLQMLQGDNTALSQFGLGLHDLGNSGALVNDVVQEAIFLTSGAGVGLLDLGVHAMEWELGGGPGYIANFYPIQIFEVPVDDGGTDDRPTAPRVLEFGYPMRGVRGWTQPSPGSERVRYPSGVSAAWIDEHEALLEGTAIHIPAETSVSVFAPQSGWNGENGWQAFLQWARRGNSFAFYPNRLTGTNIICQLADPLPISELEPAAQRSLPLRLRSTTLARFTDY